MKTDTIQRDEIADTDAHGDWAGRGHATFDRCLASTLHTGASRVSMFRLDSLDVDLYFAKLNLIRNSSSKSFAEV